MRRFVLSRLGISLPVLMLLVVGLAGCGATSDVPDGDPDADQPLVDQVGSGTARVEGVVRSVHGEEALPLGGVAVVLGDAVTHSNVDGTFTLLGVPSGRQALLVDGETVAAGDGHYGQFAMAIGVAADAELTLDRPVYLPFIADADVTEVTPGETVVVETTAPDADDETIITVRLEIPPGAARQAGVEYEGPVSLHVIPADRLTVPLPDRLAEAAGTVVSIQPVDLQFPVPVRLSVTAPASATGTTAAASQRVWSLWSFAADEADFVDVGIGALEGGRLITTAGGVRAGGTHFFSDLVATLLEPLPVAAEDDARACLAAWMDAWQSARTLANVTEPGARTVLGRLEAGLARAADSADEAAAIAAVTAELFTPAQQAVEAYQALYVSQLSAAALDELDDRLTLAEGLCGVLDDPLPAAGEPGRVELEADLEAALRTVRSNLSQYASRFDRLSAALAALEPYYTTITPTDDEAVAGYRLVAREFADAYADFTSLASPIDAYDELVTSLATVETASRALLRLMSVPASGTDDAASELVCVCQQVGTTLSSPADAAGLATLTWTPADAGGASSGAGDDELCLLLALDRDRGLCSRPVRESAFADQLAAHGAPVLISLDRALNSRSLQPGEPVADTLTADAPVHVWRFDGRARQGVDVEFASLGEALVGLARDDGPVLVADYYGLQLANLAGGGVWSVYILARDLAADAPQPYQLAATLDAGNTDFAQPITGSFDVGRRVAAVLVEPAAGESLFVEKALTDAFRYELRSPAGELVPRADYEHSELGHGSELFHAGAAGLYRLILTPLPSAFGPYRVTVHRVADAAPVAYPLGTDQTVTVTAPGSAQRFAIELASPGVATLTGTTSVSLEAVGYTLVGPGGEVLVADDLLYFDGSSFARRTLVLPEAGVYELTWQVPLESASLTGAFTFRMDVASDGDSLTDP